MTRVLPIRALALLTLIPALVHGLGNAAAILAISTLVSGGMAAPWSKWVDPTMSPGDAAVWGMLWGVILGVLMILLIPNRLVS